MCHSETAIKLIREYENLYFFEPELTWPKEEFERRVYQRWAAQEIIARIKLDSNLNPVSVIERFILESNRYANTEEAVGKGVIFRTAIEAAEELGLLFV